MARQSLAGTRFGRIWTSMIFSSHEFLLHLVVFLAGFALLRAWTRRWAGGFPWMVLYLLGDSWWIYSWRGWADFAVLAGSIGMATLAFRFYRMSVLATGLTLLNENHDDGGGAVPGGDAGGSFRCFVFGARDGAVGLRAVGTRAVARADCPWHAAGGVAELRYHALLS